VIIHRLQVNQSYIIYTRMTTMCTCDKWDNTFKHYVVTCLTVVKDVTFIERTDVIWRSRPGQHI